MPRRDDAADPGPMSPDPRRIESLAVTESDVIDALEATARSDRDIVLRVTPPFAARMRARIHDASIPDTNADGRGSGERRDAERRAGDSDAARDSGEETGEGSSTADAGPPSASASPIHIPPARFVVDPPAYPTVDDTEDELRASETPYTTERHRERHQAAVDAWREAVRERLAASVTLDMGDGETTVSVAYLGQ